MGAGTYRIGPADVFTPGDLLADAATLNGQMNALDNADFSAVPQELFDNWFSFLASWRAFYSSNFTGWGSAFLASLNDSNRDQLIQFESRFGEFASEYQSASGNALPGGVVAPSTGASDTLGALIANQLQPLIPGIGIGKVLLVLGLAAGVYFFRRPLSRAFATGAA